MSTLIRACANTWLTWCAALAPIPDLYLGGSTRAVLALFRGSQALAEFRGRDYVIPDDVKYLAEPVLAHRLITSPAARIRNLDTRTTVTEILDS